MAEEVAQWPSKYVERNSYSLAHFFRDDAHLFCTPVHRYGCDGIDLDIETGAGAAAGAGTHLVEFVAIPCLDSNSSWFVGLFQIGHKCRLITWLFFLGQAQSIGTCHGSYTARVREPVLGACGQQAPRGSVQYVHRYELLTVRWPPMCYSHERVITTHLLLR